MANVKLRDRDGILTKEGIIFRVLGYSHPRGAYICDTEYASADIFQSTDPRALRNGGTSGKVFYKFYDDEGWKFIFKNYPQYTIPHKMLGTQVVGVKKADIAEERLPQKRLKALASKPPADKLVAAKSTLGCRRRTSASSVACSTASTTPTTQTSTCWCTGEPKSPRSAKS